MGDHKNATLFDTDSTVQRYVHALKRMVTYMQAVQPSEDPSKLGHVPAPTPAPSELGHDVPLQKNLWEASDDQPRMPEFVDPAEHLASSASVRGLAFGVESGHA